MSLSIYVLPSCKMSHIHVNKSICLKPCFDYNGADAQGRIFDAAFQ